MPEYNLICRAGHRHYSPTPEKFEGRTCTYPLEIGSAKKRCQQPLNRLKPEDPRRVWTSR